jgi:hypothetical protein
MKGRHALSLIGRQLYTYEKEANREFGDFSSNEDYEDYEKIGHGNLINYGQTNKRKQHYQCKTCKNVIYI